MTGPVFETPPRIVGARFPDLNVHADQSGNVKIPKGEWDKLMSYLRSGVLIDQREVSDLEQYLERLTKFIAANYD